MNKHSPKHPAIPAHLPHKHYSVALSVDNEILKSGCLSRSVPVCFIDNDASTGLVEFSYTQ